jgi:hypothetical protein
MNSNNEKDIVGQAPIETSGGESAPVATLALEADKLRNEIASLRIQRWLAVGGAIAAIVAFLITNWDKVAPQAHIGIRSPDAFITRLADAVIENATDQKVVYQSKLEAAKKWITVPPGAYNVRIAIDGSSISEHAVALERGDYEVVRLASQTSGNMRVQTRLGRKTFAPGSQLPLAVDSSGNGFVWLFEAVSGTMKLVFPASRQTQHMISVEKSFEFDTLSVSDVAGEEKLLVLVTSTDDEADAHTLAQRFTPSFAKATAVPRNQDWGAKLVVYNVGLE